MNKKAKKPSPISPDEANGRRSRTTSSKSPVDILLERKKSAGKSMISSYEDFFSESQRKYENISEMSMHSNNNYLQLPKIDLKPGHYPPNTKIKELKASPAYKERGVSAASSTFNKYSREIARKNELDNTRNDLYQKRKFVKELHIKDQEELNRCIEQTAAICSGDFPEGVETDSFALKLMAEKKKQITKGLSRPDDRTSSQIMTDLLQKATKQKEHAKKVYKEEKLRIKNLKTKKLNKKWTSFFYLILLFLLVFELFLFQLMHLCSYYVDH